MKPNLLGAALAVLLPASVAGAASPAASPVRVAEVSCDGRHDPVGVDRDAVRFSWVMESEARGQSQRAYRLQLATSRAALQAGRPDVWDSGRIASRESVLVPYAGSALAPARAYVWRVRVEDAAGRLTAWSEPARFVTALSDASDWGEARWIGYEDMPPSRRTVPGIHGLLDPAVHPKLERPVTPLLRRVFVVRKPVAQALLFVSGLGHYEAYLNGAKVGDRFLAPGWTDYDESVLYDAYDVTAQVRSGPNALSAIVGNGFHHVAPERYYKLTVAYGWPKLLAALRLEYADGSRETIGTGPAWKAAPSAITFDSIYGGEDFDARLEAADWTSADFDDTGWGRAAAVEAPRGRLRVETDHPLRVMETREPVSAKAAGPAAVLYDFGQNASGIVRLRVRGPGGRTVTLTPSELLTRDGGPNQTASGEPYRWTYTLRGSGEESWAPRFTYYGFRYVLVDGAVPVGAAAPDDVPRVVSIEMAHTRNSAPEVGRFETSSALFDRTFELVRWAIRSNMASVLTDCPHREKLGWLEQTYLMGDAVHFNYDLLGLYRKQVADVIEAQTKDGLVPDIAPEYVEFEAGFRDSPEWGAAGVVVPWLVYRWYGDRETLERAWPTMTRYVDYLGTKADGRLLSHGLGDWFDLGPARPGEAQLTPKAVTATASYFRCLRTVAEAARVLGHAGDAARYAALRTRSAPRSTAPSTTRRPRRGPRAARPRSRCPSWSVSLPTGTRDGCSTAWSAASRRTAARSRPATSASTTSWRRSRARAAATSLYAMNARDDVPGYGFQLKKGATALTESWAALEEVSNNHLMLGHLMRWFYSGLLGIDQSESSLAYASIVLKPQVVSRGRLGPRRVPLAPWPHRLLVEARARPARRRGGGSRERGGRAASARRRPGGAPRVRASARGVARREPAGAHRRRRGSRARLGSLSLRGEGRPLSGSASVAPRPEADSPSRRRRGRAPSRSRARRTAA